MFALEPDQPQRADAAVMVADGEAAETMPDPGNGGAVEVLLAGGGAVLVEKWAGAGIAAIAVGS